MQKVLVVSGKAKQVFKYLEVVSRHKGKVCLKELVEQKAKGGK